MKSLILSPHFDDAVFSCWKQVIAHENQTLNIFSKIPKSGTHTIWDLICGDIDSNAMMQRRQLENKIALAGFSNLGLDYLDKQYRKNNLPVKELVSVIKPYCSKYDQTICPIAGSAIFKHPDHVLIRQVGVSIHHQGGKVAFYPDIPYMTLPNIPSATFLRQLERKTSALVGLNLQAHVCLLTDEELRTKIIASQAYKSQLAAVNLISGGRLKKYLRYKYEILLVPS